MFTCALVVGKLEFHSNNFLGHLPFTCICLQCYIQKTKNLTEGDYKLPKGVVIKKEPLANTTNNNEEAVDVDSDDDKDLVEELQPQEEEEQVEEEDDSDEEEYSTPKKDEGELKYKKTALSKKTKTNAPSKKQVMAHPNSCVLESDNEEASMAPTSTKVKKTSYQNPHVSSKLDSDTEEPPENATAKNQFKTSRVTRVVDSDNEEASMAPTNMKVKNARYQNVHKQIDVPTEKKSPDIWDKLSDDERKTKISTSATKAPKKTGMSWDTYMKNPEVAKKLAPKNDFWGKCKMYVLFPDDCENFAVIVAIEQNNNKGGNSLSFPHIFFVNGIECAANCQLDVDIIEKYASSLQNNGQECQRRAIPHGKNECSFNTYMNVRTDHKISVFVIGRQNNSVKKDLSDMQHLFDAIVASESFMKMCQQQAKNAVRQGPSMIAMQEDDSAVWNYLQGSLQGNTVFEVTQIHHLDHLLMDMDIKMVLKQMYGEKVFKTKADVGWKEIKIR